MTGARLTEADPTVDLLILIHSLRGGGAERVAVNLAAYWQARGCHVALVTQLGPAHDAYAVPEGVQRFVLDQAHASRHALQAAWSNGLRVWRLRRLLRRLRPRVVLGMMTRSSVLAVVASRGLGCRVLVSEHTHPPIQQLPRAWQRLRRWAYARADAVVALTRGTAQWLDAEVPGITARVIPNAVSWPLDVGEPVVEPTVPAGRKVLLAVGRLHPVKGFDCLLHAFAELAQAFDQWDLVILGEGPERAALERAREALGLNARVQFPGRVGNVGDWYHAADLYVLSSRAEGLSNTLLEAMASGLPCVAFDCDTGPREIIRDGIDGVLVRPVQDVPALATQLAALMADADLRRRYAERALDVLDRFGTARVMALWEPVIRGRPGG